MKTTQEKILEYIKKETEVSPDQISKVFAIGKAMVHRHLKKLVEKKMIAKKGVSPKVLYFYVATDIESRVQESRDIVKNNFLSSFLRCKTSFWDIKKENNVNFNFLLQKSAFFSSKIEGNTLDLNSFIKLKTLKRGKNKEVKEIDDLVAGYEFAKSHSLNEGNLLKIHKIISRQFVSANRRGKYRQESVGVFSEAGLEYMAIESELIKTEMSLFFASIQELLNKKMTKKESYFWSLWIHLQFVLIHPFFDGNGRMARLLEKWFLAEKLGKGYWYLETEKYYWENLQKYYKSLNLGQNYWVLDFKKAGKFFRFFT